MKDLAQSIQFTWGSRTGGIRTPYNQFAPNAPDMCYTSSALITSVVLCGPSGAVLDLRLPASSFLRTFYA
jgi:hypothetical protein